jgi:hypothetical protein
MSISPPIPVRPVTGGFFRPFGTAWFIIEFLKGNGPEGSKQINPDIGAPMTDIHFEYENALHRAYAKVYYRLAKAGWRAKAAEISDPIMTLYHYSRKQRSAKRYSYYRA